MIPFPSDVGLERWWRLFGGLRFPGRNSCLRCLHPILPQVSFNQLNPKFSVDRSLLLRINQCSSSLIFQFIQMSSRKLQETGVETARVKCCDHLILSVQTLLKFSSIKHQTTCFVYIAILFSRDSGETFRGKRNWRKGKGEQNVEREKETVERGETRPIWPRKVRKMKGAVWYA